MRLLVVLRSVDIRSVVNKALVLGLVVAWSASFSGCMSAYKKSIGAETEKNYTRIFLTDYQTAWSAVNEALKSFALDISNQETGIVQTRWKDNTVDKNFAEQAFNQTLYVKAQYRVRVSVSKGFFNGQNSVKIGILKEQVVATDVLDGWRVVATDGYDENTLLYRMGRIIYIRTELARLEEEKTQREIRESGVQ